MITLQSRARLNLVGIPSYFILEIIKLYKDYWNHWVNSLPLKERAEILAQAESFKHKTPDRRFFQSDSEIIKLPSLAA